MILSGFHLIIETWALNKLSIVTALSQNRRCKPTNSYIRLVLQFIASESTSVHSDPYLVM